MGKSADQRRITNDRQTTFNPAERWLVVIRRWSANLSTVLAVTAPREDLYPRTDNRANEHSPLESQVSYTPR